MNENGAMEIERGTGRPGLVRRLYEWVIHWASTPMAVPALAILAVAEASFFPIPPDVLLIAMALALPKRSFWYATVASVASVAGGLIGYGIGVGLMRSVGCPLVSAYHGQATFDWLAVQFTQYDFWAIFVAAVTPIPYKIFTITAGAVGTHVGTFLLASALGRPVRFFAIALLIYFLGPPVKRFLERYFNLLSVVFVVLLVGGFAAFKLLDPGGEGGPGATGPSRFEAVCAEGAAPSAEGPARATGALARFSGGL